MRYVTKKDRLRRRLIDDWRGVDGGPLQDLPAKSLGELIPQILKAWKLNERLRGDEVTTAWQEMVGEFLAQHTAPDGIQRAVLTVRVTQPAVHHTLMMKKAFLLKKLQEKFGVKEIRDIRFRVG